MDKTHFVKNHRGGPRKINYHKEAHVIAKFAKIHQNNELYSRSGPAALKHCSQGECVHRIWDGTCLVWRFSDATGED